MNMGNEEYAKKTALIDKKIIWKLEYDEESFKEYKKVTEFLSFIEEKIADNNSETYNDIKIIVESIFDVVTKLSTTNTLREDFVNIHEKENLRIDMDFGQRYVAYGVHRDKLKLVVKFKIS